MPSYLDLGVIGVIFLSALLAMLRGFTREVLAIASWGIAAVAAKVFYPMALPFLKPHIPKEDYAIWASIVAVFIFAIVVISIITVRISDMILDSKIGALDRSLGFVFGAVRGLLLCTVAFAFFIWFEPSDKAQPEWVKTAKLTPLLTVSADKIRDALPNDPESWFAKFKKPKAGAPSEEAPADADPEGRPADAKPTDPKAAADPKANGAATPAKPAQQKSDAPSAADKQRLDGLVNGTPAPARR